MTHKGSFQELECELERVSIATRDTACNHLQYQQIVLLQLLNAVVGERFPISPPHDEFLLPVNVQRESPKNDMLDERDHTVPFHLF